MQFELTKAFIEQIETAVAASDQQFIRDQLDGMHAADINSILMKLDTEQSKFIIQLLDDIICAEILSDLDSDIRTKFLKSFEPPEIARYISEMDSDDAADIINEQKAKVRSEIIKELPDDNNTENILDLLRYEEDTAGGLMAKELIKADYDWTVNQCIDEIRKQAENVEKIFSIYVVDGKDRLKGIVSLKKLILSVGSSKVADIFEDSIVSVDAFDDEDHVSNVMRKYDLVAVPVINFQGKLVGRITIDDVVDVIDEHAEIERNLMGGMTESVESSDTVWMLTRARLPWLIIGMAGGLLGAQLIGLFEEQLRIIPTMAFFIPLIMATGGNAGIQSSTIVVQSLAGGDTFSKGIYRQFMKSLIVAVVNGLAIAILVLIFNMIFNAFDISLVVAISLFCVVVLASLVGTVTPLVLDRLKINPALASGPFITTFNDLLGIAVYFTIAELLLTNLNVQ